jgi:nucleoside-diphosphate-sugar epimerase
VIFLTGGTGLLGLHILDELHSRSLPVRALVRDEAGARLVATKGAAPLVGTVEDPATWDRAAGSTAIIHGAAIIAGRHSWERFLEVNVEATRMAARRARELGIPLIHISSVAVYGRHRQPGTPITEAHPFAPLNETEYYARSKRLAEEAVWAESEHGLRAVAIRPCVVYGEGDRLFLPRLVRTLSRRRVVPLIGKGDRPLSLVHSRNVAQAVVNALAIPSAWGQAYNTTNDDEITAAEFVAAVGRGAGRPIRTISLPAGPLILAAKGIDRLRKLAGPSRYPGSVATAVRYWRGGNPYSSDKAKGELNWRPAIRHADGIERVVRSILGAGRRGGS